MSFGCIGNCLWKKYGFLTKLSDEILVVRSVVGVSDDW